MENKSSKKKMSARWYIYNFVFYISYLYVWYFKINRIYLIIF